MTTPTTQRLAKVREVAAMIKADAEADVRKHDGQTIDGRRLGEIHGELNGLIVGLANCIEQLAADDRPAEIPHSMHVTDSAGDRAGYRVGEIIRHSRRLHYAPIGMVVYNTGNLANITDGGPGDGAQFFLHIGSGAWQPCTEAGRVQRLPDWPDGFGSDQLFLPARVWAVAP